MDIENEKLFLKNHKKTLDNSPFNCMTPFIAEKKLNDNLEDNDKEIYFIVKAEKSLIKELIEQKEKGTIPERLTASMCSYLEGENIIFRIDFIDYPFFFETEFYNEPEKQEEYTKALLNQDKFALFILTQDRATDERKLITSKVFNLRKAMVTAFKEVARKKKWI